ncbi:hypothetical protein CC86DRAFT_350658 [Ophiobolus disseminans]|uniref:Elongator complex protein 5 n=1 Tax=Ophiobolus disseminans TaxID=1469910 RepID=A0A6A7A082_9PLEO|nr:hypothetical protein CC86DRAFT_350658 [Ophiobolus disseminans]
MEATIRVHQQFINITTGLPKPLGRSRKAQYAPKPTNTVRARDCNSWIKKSNFRLDGVSKRKRKPEGRPARNAMVSLNHWQHQRHHVHLMSRVLNIRTNASPFTLILDDLNQRALPFVCELVRRGLSRNVNVVVVAFETTRFPGGVRHIPAHAASNGDQLLLQLTRAMDEAKESLVIVDSLYELLQIEGIDMSALFNLVAGKFASTLVGVYHQDMLPAQDAQNPYAPQTLDLLKYLATSIVICKSFAHVLAAKVARERSLAEPTYGLLQGAEGVVECLDANDHRGIVLEAEFRRKSGRPESEVYFLRTAHPSDYNVPVPGMIFGTLKQEFVALLEQVPAYGNSGVLALINLAADDIESTFNLGLTEKQKQAREGVVLPYTDAQKGEGGEGGRILYDMGVEDDFDEEEDEI